MSERSIFLSALEVKDAASRNAFLAEACAGNSQLLAEVEALLKSHGEAGAFLETPAAESVMPTIAEGGAAAQDRAEDDLSFLSPPVTPGSLGRLGHYEVKEVLGRGAFGIVLRGFDEKLHRMVAIKVMNPELAATSPPRKRFLREARSSASVRHENIVAIHAVEEQPIPYLVMEYIPGMTLQQRLDQHGPLDVGEVLRIGQQIAAGLAAAHAKGLIHRDIKPANILLESGLEERAKITDFGLARAADDASLTQSGLIAGTPMYMAPEQARGETLDHRADLFSLGSVLYVMASGRPPFRAPNTIAVLKRVCEDTPRPIDEVIPGTPKWLCDIIAKLLAKEPDDRFQTAKEVAEVLAKAFDHLQNPAAAPRPVAAVTPKVKTDVAAEAALKSLRGPGLGLVLTACLNVIDAIGLTLAYFIVWNRPGSGSSVGPSEFVFLLLIVIAGSGVILIGGLNMMRAQRYGLCVLGSVAALLVGPMYIVGWPVAIWALIVLSRPEVRELFERRVSKSAAMPAGEPKLSLADRTWKWGTAAALVAFFVWYFGPSAVLMARNQGVIVLDSASTGASLRLSGPDGQAFNPTGSGGSTYLTPGTYLVEVLPPSGLSLTNLAYQHRWWLNSFSTSTHPTKATALKIGRGDRVRLTPTFTKVPPADQALGRDGMTIDPKAGTLSLPYTPMTEWQPLFNGRDLTGWKTHPKQQAGWSVEGGAIVGHVPNGTAGHLFSERGDFGDFDLHAEAKIEKTGNSGIYFRAPFELRFLDNTYPPAYEVQIYNDDGRSSYDQYKTGSLHAVQIVSDVLVKTEDWFSIDLSARGNRFTVKVNGVTTIDGDFQDQYRHRPRGHIALQTAGGKVRFRTVEVREPLPNIPAELEFASLFNGRDLTGWKTTAELPGKWEVKNGLLTGSSQQSYLFSERGDFANFHLRVEAKTNGLGGSGIHFRAPAYLRHGPRAGMTQPASGYEVDLFNQPAPVGTILEIVKGAPLRLMCRAVNNSAYRAGEWFTLEVIADQNHFITKFNGQETVDCWDSFSRSAAGHLALSVFDPQTVVQFRKIEIRELSPPAASSPTPQVHHYSTNEWIDVIPLIDPQLDKWDMRLTGKNEWRIEQGELVVGNADDKPHKLLFPLDADFFPSFECELEVTRRAGDQGFNLNFPTASGDTPLSFDFPTRDGVFLRHVRKGITPLADAPQIETGKRMTVRVEVRRQQVGDRITVWNNEALVGTWTGDRNELASGNNEGYRHHRRISLWIHGGGSKFVFHRIRVRMLDGGNAETLRPMAIAAPVAPPPTAVAPFDASLAKAHQEAWARRLDVPVEYTNPLGAKFRLIPPGEFLMGSTEDESKSLSRALEQAEASDFDKFVAQTSGPQHPVRITQPFYCGTYEVTVGEYRKFVDETKYLSTLQQLGVKRFEWTDSIAEPNADQRAVIGVSWDDAQAFCQWRSKLDGVTYGLPSEAQWEYACRAGTTTLWSFGDDAAQLADHAVFGRESFWPAEVVGSRKPNAFGLFDMHGNADEWCLDWHNRLYYGTSPVDDPVCLENPTDNHSGRVSRGGTATSVAWWTRSTTRPWDFPTVPTNPKGFRMVITGDLSKLPRRPLVERSKTESDAVSALKPANIESTPASR